MGRKDTPDKLHGNAARIDPEKKVESLYQANMVTVSHRKDHETPVLTDENVEYARRFEQENQK